MRYSQPHYLESFTPANRGRTKLFQGTDECAIICVKSNSSWSMDFGHHDDLSKVEREVLNDVEDCLKYGNLSPLDEPRLNQIGSCQAAKELINLSKGALKLRQKLISIRSIARQKLGGPVGQAGSAAYPA